MKKALLALGMALFAAYVGAQTTPWAGPYSAPYPAWYTPVIAGGGINKGALVLTTQTTPCPDGDYCPGGGAYGGSKYGYALLPDKSRTPAGYFLCPFTYNGLPSFWDYEAYRCSFPKPPPPPPSSYALAVVSGTGSGSYAPGAVVPITANLAPTRSIFKSWTGAAVANASAASTTLTMPAAATTVTATYMPVTGTTACAVSLTVTMSDGSTVVVPIPHP